jgi:cell division protein FtsB
MSKRHLRATQNGMEQRSHKWYWLCLAVAVVMSSAYAWHRDLHGKYLKYLARRTETESLLRERDALDAEKKGLNAKVESLGNDMVEIEASIRRDKGLVRADEMVFQIELPDE